MFTVEEVDSGMVSRNSKADTPEKLPAIEGLDEDEEDETISERLWGLTEMFPDPVRNVTGAMFHAIKTTISATYSFTRKSSWLLASSSMILFAPVMMEVERYNTQEAMRKDQQQVLLGPSAGAR